MGNTAAKTKDLSVGGVPGGGDGVHGGRGGGEQVGRSGGGGGLYETVWHGLVPNCTPCQCAREPVSSSHRLAICISHCPTNLDHIDLPSTRTWIFPLSH